MMVRSINIEEFGAVADGVTKCTAAINNAIEYAIQSDDDIYIVFGNGVYYLDALAEYKLTANNERYLFRHSNGENIHICGNNSVLLIEDSFCGLFEFGLCKNISVSGFSIKYVKAPWVQAEITDINIDDGIFMIDVLNNSDILDDERLKDKKLIGFLRDKQNPRLMKHNTWDFFGTVISWEKTSEKKYKINFDDKRNVLSDGMEVGDKLILNNRPHGGNILFTYKCENVSFLNCDIYASSNGVYVGAYNLGNVLVSGIKTIYENQDSWLVANADAFHFQHGTHSIEISNCVIEGINDDIINLYHLGLSVSKIFSDNKIEITNHIADWLPVKGDRLIIYNNREGIVKAVVSVEAVDSSENNKKCVVTFNNSVNNLYVGNDKVESDAIYSADALFNNVIIRNNIFRCSRRYGMLLRCRNAVVENNLFYDLGGPALYSCNETYYNEGLGLYNLCFINNTVYNTAFVEKHGQRKYGAAICIRSNKTGENGPWDHTFSISRINKNLLIENNNIDYSSKNSIVIGSAENVIIRNNTLKKNNEAVGSNDIVLENVSNCTVNNM